MTFDARSWVFLFIWSLATASLAVNDYVKDQQSAVPLLFFAFVWIPAIATFYSAVRRSREFVKNRFQLREAQPLVG